MDKQFMKEVKIYTSLFILREELGSWKAVAFLLGVPPEVVRSWVRGLNLPREEMGEMILELASQVNIDKILERYLRRVEK